MTDAVVPSAEIVIRNLETGLERETVGNAVGVYRFPAVEPGKYSIEFKAKGFSSKKLESVEVGTIEEIVINQRLEIAGLTITVNVVDAPAGIDVNKTNPTLSRTFDRRPVEELPIGAMRDVTRLALLAPTVARAPGSNEFSANGQRARNNNFLIDGTDNNDLTLTLNSSRIIPEGIAEFQIQTASYSAEFGRNSGAQVQTITRSGTNAFHGDIWEYYRGNWMEPLALRNKDAGLKETPRFSQHQFGGAVGGPIVKDRTFFFGLFEYHTRREAADGRNATGTSIPTPTGYAALQNVPLASGQTAQSRQAMLDALAFLPEIYSQMTTYNNLTTQSVNGVPIQVGSILIPLANPYNLWYNQGRIDHQLTAKDSINYRYLLDHQDRPDVESNKKFGSKWTASDQIFNQNHAIGYTRIFSPRFINEFRTAYIRNNDQLVERDPNLSSVTISSLSSTVSIGGLSNFPQGRIGNTYQWQDVATYLQGRHNLKFGLDIRYNRLANRASFDSKGSWVFQTLQDFMNNQALSLTQAVNDAPYDARQTNQNYFFQDDFKAGRNLTFNLGIRYEYSNVPLGFFGAATDEIAAAGVPRPAQPDKNNWAPRVGFAYSPSQTSGLLGKLFGSEGQSSIRGGFGVAYDVLFYNILTNNASNYPRVVKSITNRPGTDNLYPTLAPKITTIPPFDPMLAFTNTQTDVQNPTTHFWNLSVQRQFHKDFLLEVGYTGNRSYHQLRLGQLNPPVLTSDQETTVINTKNSASIPGIQARRLNPAWGSRVLIESSANSEYHAGFVRLDKRVSHGLMFGVNYTYSANISESDEALGVTAFLNAISINPQNFFDARNERGRSIFDRPHRFAAHFIYDIPWLTAPSVNNAVFRQVFVGWQLSGIIEFESGQPFTLRTGADSAGIGSTAPARPDFNPNGILIEDPVTHNLRTFTMPIDGTGIGVTALGTNGLPLANSMSGGGTLGRNTLRGPGFQNWNFSLMKTFPITERLRFQFRTDFINAWNHNNFQSPEARMAQATFGKNTAPLLTDSRTMLMSAKLKF
jgi:hypothetical protein